MALRTSGTRRTKQTSKEASKQARGNQDKAKSLLSHYFNFRNEDMSIAVESQFSNIEPAEKKIFRASTGFEPVASAFALQCSTS